MKWDRDYDSPNVEDRRGEGPPTQMGGAGMLLPFFLRFGWKGGLLAAALFFGGRYLLSHQGPAQHAAHDEGRAFVGFVLDDVQKTWARDFAARNARYEPARAVLYSGATETACGLGRAAVGPFYCPADEKVYLDLTFFQELHDRFGAPGDFAQAYVIAHEVGHHVQRLLGVFDRLEREPSRVRAGAGRDDVRSELQADCYAGVWARDAAQRKILDPGDLEEALRAAAAVGDDTLQRASTGTVRPESWTHGSAEQRARWFRRGYDNGRLEACDTFGAGRL